MNLRLVMMSYDSQITIDGPAATGKTTVGKIVADKIGWKFLDTGVMYRAATKVLLESDIDFKNEDAMAQKITDSDMVIQQRLATLNPSSPSPSIEAILHALIPFKYDPKLVDVSRFISLALIISIAAADSVTLSCLL